MIGAEKPDHYKWVFTITELTINGIDCSNKMSFYWFINRINSKHLFLIIEKQKC